MPDAPNEIQMTLRAAANLLDTGQYDQVDALLYTAQMASVQRNDAFATMAVAAARQICASCLQCHAEVAWHQQASEVAAQREQQLRQHAHLLLDSLSNQEANAPISVGALSKQYTAELQIGVLPKRVTLFQRALHLFEQGKRWLGAKRDRPLLSSKEREKLSLLSVVPSAELTTEDPTLFSVDQTPATPPLPAASEATRPEIRASFEVAAPTSAPLPKGEISVATPSEPVASETPSLIVCCLGPFQVYQDDQRIEEWQSSKGQAIFKYLVTHRERPIPKELLMELFWPEASPEAARNNLNVAIYGLRRALRQTNPAFSHVVFQNDAYLLNPELQIWVDVEEFSHHFRAGQRLEQTKEAPQAIHEYHAAEALYQGEFLEEDRYEDWLQARRQSLQDDYFTLLDRLSRHYLEQTAYDACILRCSKLLAIDTCRENAHRRLMRCYSRQGYHHLALRQYHLCVEALQRELEVKPDKATQALYTQIRQRRPV